jgi:UDP-N-acetylmuramoyl-tripeptide--D-alanyl-D-alanine ligase
MSEQAGMSAGTWKASVRDLAGATGGRILSPQPAEFHGVGTDTRQSLDGKLFIPLKGEQFDAHDFVAKAVEQGAAAILVHHWREEWKPLLARAAFVRVDDTLQALQAFATHWRRQHGFQVIGITGSNGKTSTKEFTYALVKDSLPASASKGSYNNHWGVPLSILAAGPEHRLLILEMGMNKPGEITRLCQIAEPQVVAVTMVGRGHIGELGGVEGIARAKEEIYLAAPGAVHVFNMDNEWTLRMQARSKAKQIRFSSVRTDVEVNLRARRVSWDGLDLTGEIGGVAGQALARVLGRHNTVNLMAAASLALAVGVKPDAIWRRLGAIHDSSWGRNQILQLKNGARILFDAYNANPDSMTALMKNLCEMDVEGKKYLVAGDMKELGAFSETSHEEIGERAGSVGFEKIWYIGRYSDDFERGLKKTGAGPRFVASPGIDAGIAKSFFEDLKAGDLVAVKGSRGMQLEKVVESWPLTAPLGKKP